ncbi:MAG: phosphatase PAP2 family protein [Bacteroidetes bacterium]|nr:phosphatase PAP2 family protein [Bacteroidota bacterium]
MVLSAYFSRYKINQFLFILFLLPGLVSGQDSDSLERITERPIKMVSGMIPPLCLISYGIGIQGHSRLIISSYQVRDFRNRNFKDFSTPVDDYLVYAGPVMVAGLNTLGIKGSHNIPEEALLFSSCFLLTSIFTAVLKVETKVMRPDGSSRNAMPSGHTSTAFANATVMYLEYRNISPWYGVAAYTMAGSVGMLRIMNNRHWASDVLVGAGLGVIVTRTIYWSYDALKHKCH